MKGRPCGSKNTVLHIWKDEEKEYLKEITPGHHYKEIQELMNGKFDYKFTLSQIKGVIARSNFNTGFTGQFKKEHTPFNKGMKGICAEGSEKGWFEKGVIPPNHKKVGSESITIDGYTTVKIAEPNKWRLKQQIVWEKYNGKMPSGHVIIFGDADKSNLDINNLILVSRQQLLMMNRNNLIQSDADLTRTGVIIADLYQAIGKRKER